MHTLYNVGKTALLLPKSTAQLCGVAPWHYRPTLQHGYNQTNKMQQLDVCY